MNTIKTAWILSLMVILYACGKPDELAPVITISMPQANDVLPGTQSIQVRVSISDNRDLHMVHIMVMDNTNGGHLLHKETHVDSRNFELNESFIPQPGKNYTIEIGAHDHAQNVAAKTIVVYTN